MQGDIGVVTAEDRAKHDAQFSQFKPVGGFITGEQARGFFMQSGLQVAVLGQIWGLADMNQDGKMDKLEFSIAMHLIKMKLQGRELPKTLPASLKTGPVPAVGNFGMPSQMPPMQPAGGGGFATLPRFHSANSYQMNNTLPTSRFPGAVPLIGSTPGSASTLPTGSAAPPQPASGMPPAPPSAEWAIPHTNKLKYNQTFNSHDRMRRGFIEGIEAKNILSQTGLTHNLLAKIWALADINADGKLTSDEFCVAMHLVDMARSGQNLPPKLPPELVPPSFRGPLKSGPPVGGMPKPVNIMPGPPNISSMPPPATPPAHQDKFADLLGGMGAGLPPPSGPPPLMPTNETKEAEQSDFMSNVTFEDRRKENFDKGQAELERRRAQLQEELKKAEDERLAAERAEQEKRERIRQEQERKKQLEIEKQLEKQRQLEMEREEQRRKALEQRESARREMERQRQMEWERQRRDQLLAEKQRQHSSVEQLQSQVGQLKLELEALDNKKSELRSKIDLSKTSVSELTSAIDNMRQNRDSSQTDIDKAQKDSVDFTKRLQVLQTERKQLELQVQSTHSVTDDRYKAILHSINTKKEHMTQLREQVSGVETETSGKTQEMDTTKAQFTDIVSQLNKANSETQKLKEQYLKKQGEYREQRRAAEKSNSALGSAWFDDPFPKSTSAPTSDPFSSTTPDLFAQKTSAVTSDLFSSTPPVTSNKNSSVNSDLFSNSTPTSDVFSNKNSSVTSDIFSNKTSSVTSDLFSDATGSSDIFSNGTSTLTSDPFKDATSPPSSDVDIWGGSSQVSSTPNVPTKNQDSLSGMFSDLFSPSTKTSSQESSTWADSFFKDLKKPSVKPRAGIQEVTPDPQDSASYVKYTALYPFEARNADELTFQAGDTVMVGPDQAGAEPGWMKGEIGSKKGWFPQAYVSAAENQADTTTGNTPTDNSDKTDFVATFETGSPTAPSLLTTSDQSPFTAVPSSGPSPTPGQPAPEALLACALYPWKAKKDNHLTFDKGDVILVKEQQDMWWSGELNGKSGWFPKSYVKVQVQESSPVEQSPAVIQSPTQPEEPKSPSPVQGQGELYEASYSYQSPEPGDLSFLQGDLITVTKSEGEWWTGSLQGKTGIFPANYVTKSTKESASVPVSQPLEVSTSSADVPSQSQPADGSGQVADSLSVQSTLKLSPKKAEIAQVVAQYKATGPEQLSLTPNQLIQVRKKSPSGWWEGELQVRGQKRRIGWFPANYVKVLSSSARNTPDSKSLSPTPATQDGAARAPTPVSLPHPTSAPAVEQVIALYPYEPQHEDELAFTKSAVINVINKDNSDWWKGEFNGVTGVFPSNYVQPLSSQDLAGSSNAWSMDEGSSNEQKRQMHITELMSSEETYRKDLTTVVEVFCKILNPVLTPEEIRVIFINWKDIRMCSTKLVKSWRVRREMTKGSLYTVGDILCENLPHMSPYVRYCSCQLTAAALLQKKSENDARFKESHKKCVQDPRTGGMPLSSFLLKPMQRITKYPLLIEKVLQHTPEDHVDHQNLQEALSKANELCNQVNEAVRETENSDRLEWMQDHIQCEGLNEKLTFNSVTNCLGPRKYLHSGTLYKAKSGKELVGFLCSDFLLLTQPERHLGAVSNIFSFDARTNNMTFKLYRNPIFLNDIMISKVSENEPDTQMFQLSHIDRIYTLKANSTVERDSWLKKIQVASKHYLDTERKKREKAHSVRRIPVVGRLLVVIMGGSNLIPGEDGKSDPYCEVSIGAQEHKTKVIENTLNPRWNASMQFTVKDIRQDVLCITVYDRDLFTPNDFLGRTEVRIEDIYNETKTTKGPITKNMKLLEVDSGEVLVKLDLQLYKDSD